MPCSDRPAAPIGRTGWALESPVVHSAAMDDERWASGMPVLDRQTVPGNASARPRSVPETRPTPLRSRYVELSFVALVCGAVAISAVELGAPIGSPLVKLCLLVGGPFLVVTMADALLRIWRSAWAWMPVDRGRGLFRLSWVLAIVGLYAALAVAAWLVLTA